jgi:hypothetical protein
MFNSQYDSRYPRAVGRIVFGVVMILGGATFVERLLRVREAHAVKTLAIVWLAALFAGWLFAQLASVTARRVEIADIFTISWVLPTLGVALVLPLTLHIPFALALGSNLSSFDDWARISLAIAGPAQVTFAFLATLRAARLAQGRPAMSATRIYIITLIASSIPFALLFMIPPLLVGLTGFAILPLLVRMEGMIDRERGTTELPRAIVVA